MFELPIEYDVLVVGSGHAGIEAALAAARLGCRTAMLTQNADATGIQFRMLNKTKGPSVRAPRVQCDKKAYQFRMKAILEQAENVDLKQATVANLLVEEGRVFGIETDLGLRILARSVVMTSGTFLRGLLHVGERSKPGGRMADANSGLSDSLRQLG